MEVDQNPTEPALLPALENDPDSDSNRTPTPHERISLAPSTPEIAERKLSAGSDAPIKLIAQAEQDLPSESNTELVGMSFSTTPLKWLHFMEGYTKLKVPEEYSASVSSIADNPKLAAAQTLQQVLTLGDTPISDIAKNDEAIKFGSLYASDCGASACAPKKLGKSLDSTIWRTVPVRNNYVGK